MTFKDLDIVVVRSLRTAVRPVDGTEGVRRQPVVGDVGTVVHVLGPTAYIVACVDADGRTPGSLQPQAALLDLYLHGPGRESIAGHSHERLQELVRRRHRACLRGHQQLE